MPKTRTRLLFVCSGNRDRSPTAEALFHDSPEYEARSAGTLLCATRKVTQQMLDWADVVFVMSEREAGHVSYLKWELQSQRKADPRSQNFGSVLSKRSGSGKPSAGALSSFCESLAGDLNFA